MTLSPYGSKVNKKGNYLLRIFINFVKKKIFKLYLKIKLIFSALNTKIGVKLYNVFLFKV